MSAYAKTRVSLDEAQESASSLREQYRIELNEECPSLPFPWKWCDSSAEVVSVNSGHTTVSLTARGMLMFDTRTPIDHLVIDESIIDAMRAQLASEAKS